MDPGIGGTWRENVYPGVQNDVPAHIVSLCFDHTSHLSERMTFPPMCMNTNQHTVRIPF